MVTFIAYNSQIFSFNVWNKQDLNIMSTNFCDTDHFLVFGSKRFHFTIESWIWLSVPGRLGSPNCYDSMKKNRNRKNPIWMARPKCNGAMHFFICVIGNWGHDRQSTSATVTGSFSIFLQRVERGKNLPFRRVFRLPKHLSPLLLPAWTTNRCWTGSRCRLSRFVMTTTGYPYPCTRLF